MSKIIFDEGVPEPLQGYLPAHEVTSVNRLNWKSTRNGKLLAAIEEKGFEVFITNDKRMEFDQNLARRPFGILLLSTNHWPTMKPNAAKIVEAVDGCKPGSAVRVDCGHFVPARRRKLVDPAP